MRGHHQGEPARDAELIEEVQVDDALAVQMRSELDAIEQERLE